MEWISQRPQCGGHRLPLLVVVANNRSFFNDEIHQERVARHRGRPVENRAIGQHIRGAVLVDVRVRGGVLG